MFGEAAEALLKMSGLSGNVPGAIMADDVPKALAELQAALKAQSEADGSLDVSGISDNAEQDDENAKNVGLGTRAVPLIELFEAAIRSHDNVQWDT